MVRRLEESSTMPLNAKTMALCQKCGTGGCGALSGGRLEVTVSAAGEVVPAFEVLDAVGSGVAEMATPLRSNGRARSRPRRSSPQSRSGSCLRERIGPRTVTARDRFRCNVGTIYCSA
jgi:hypothetical protein